MRKRGMKAAWILLAAALLLPQTGAGAEALTGPSAVRVGLAYGSGAPAEARLENSIGLGYRLGIMDAFGAFTLLFTTQETKITMRPTLTEGASPNAISVFATGTENLLFQFDGGSPALIVQPGQDDSLKTVTWFANHKYFGTFEYSRVNGGNTITVVNVVEQEDYINCVVSQEMSDSWPLEALKAQAVTARTYARRAMENSKHRGQGFDLCNTTDCQAYPGAGRIGSNTTRAVSETTGICAWYEGRLAQTYYYACNGGATEDSKNVWGGSVPYLVGKLDPWEATVESKISNYRWTVTYTKTELENALRSSGRACGTLANVTVTPTNIGNAKSVTFTDTDGKSWTIAGDSARIFLHTGSVRYTLSTGNGYSVNGSSDTLSAVTGAYAIDGSGVSAPIEGVPYALTSAGTELLQTPLATGDSYSFTGSGNGHNVGMSQWGAYAMAQSGMTYTDILNFYFTGIEIR